MSYIGVGDEDWVELDLDLFERARASRLQHTLSEEYERLVTVLGCDFEVETLPDDQVFILIDGRRRFRAEVSRSDRLIFTDVPNPEGPL